MGEELGLPPSVRRDFIDMTKVGPRSDHYVPPSVRREFIDMTKSGPMGDHYVPPSVRKDFIDMTKAGPVGDLNVPPWVRKDFIDTTAAELVGDHGVPLSERKDFIDMTKDGSMGDRNVPPSVRRDFIDMTTVGPMGDYYVPPWVRKDFIELTGAGPKGDLYARPHGVLAGGFVDLTDFGHTQRAEGIEFLDSAPHSMRPIPGLWGLALAVNSDWHHEHSPGDPLGGEDPIPPPLRWNLPDFGELGKKLVADDYEFEELVTDSGELPSEDNLGSGWTLSRTFHEIVTPKKKIYERWLPLADSLGQNVQTPNNMGATSDHVFWKQKVYSGFMRKCRIWRVYIRLGPSGHQFLYVEEIVEVRWENLQYRWTYGKEPPTTEPANVPPYTGAWRDFVYGPYGESQAEAYTHNAEEKTRAEEASEDVKSAVADHDSNEVNGQGVKVSTTKTYNSGIARPTAR